MNTIRTLTLFACLAIAYSPCTLAAVAIVVNTENTSTLNIESIRKIFLGKIQTYANGEKIDAFNLPKKSPLREVFRENVLRKSEVRLQSYWSRMLFFPTAQPPGIIGRSKEVKALIKANPHAIGYIDTQDLDDTVRVLMILGESANSQSTQIATQ